MRREAKRNAVNRELADAMDAEFNRLEDDPDLWVGILTGTPLVFSAGSDLSAGGDYYTERGGEYGIIRRKRANPLIAAVEGPALGGGLEIVLACDAVVASRGAVFGFPEAARGVLASCAGLFRAPRALPLNVAREMVMTCQPIGAERLHGLGFVNQLTDNGGAVAGALQMAEQICQNAPLSVRGSLQVIEAMVSSDDEAGWVATVAAREAVGRTNDCSEGVQAFLGKRPPVWTAT